MTGDKGMQFWRPAGVSSPDFSCAFLNAGCPSAHLHEEWQFAVAEDSCAVSVGAYRRCTVYASDVVVIAPYQVHTELGGFGTAPRWRVLHISAPTVSRLSAATGARGGTGTAIRNPVVTDPAAAMALGALLRGAEAREPPEAFERQARCWLGTFLERHTPAIVPAPAPPAVERARTYLLEHPLEAVSLQEVRAVAGVTVSYLVRSFARVVGLPPMSYHAQVRLARARRLLAEGRPASWVAYECGFADQSHLTRRFKESYGLTPGAFSAKQRAGRAAVPMEASAA
jgi:AraC-like DNA-binding protein